MSQHYAVVSARIRQELQDIQRVVERVERAIIAARQRPEDQDLYLDSVALNLHDFYAGLERVFEQIATTLDQSLPAGREWHRDLLRQMTVAIPQNRPQVLSIETVKLIDEYLRFRHVVRNIYTFEFDPVRLEHLAEQLRPTFAQVQLELLAFANFLDQLAQKGP